MSRPPLNTLGATVIARNAEAAAVAFVVAVTVSPIVGAACRRFGVLDHPGPLKIHNRPIPRLGGVAIAIAIAAGMLSAGHFELRQSLAVAGFFLVWFTGLLDDIRSLRPSARLISQIVSALLLWCAEYGLPGATAGILNLVGAIILIVAFLNAWNFWDGADGLAAGTAAIATLAFFCAPGQSSTTAALAASLAAACGGFLIWNFPPAKLFMGDAGSTLLGFAIALLTLDFYRSNSASFPILLFPVFVAALPLLDAALAIIRRFRRAQALVQGDRCHMYDLLFSRGWQSCNVAIVFFGLTSVLAGLGWLALLTKRTAFTLSGAAVVVAVLGGAVRLGALGRAQNFVCRELAPTEAISSRSAR